MGIKCSILIPMYNQEKLIEKCIDSLPERADIEIIVVDDKSTDNSLKVIDKYKQIKLLKNDKNLGIGLTRQKLLDAAVGEYIFFIDSDDYVYTKDFEDVLNSLDGSYDVVESMRLMNNNYRYHSKVWQGAFIKTSIAKSVAFKDVRCHEDTYWKNEILEKYPNLHTILLEDKTVYHYNYPRVGSLTYMDKHSNKSTKTSRASTRIKLNVEDWLDTLFEKDNY